MGKKGIHHRRFSVEFKLSVLSDYYQSRQSEKSICRKYQLSQGTVLRWEKAYVLEEKELPLSSELLRKLGQMRKRKATETAKASRTREEELEDEIIRLRKALEYSELRNEALNEVLKIGREQFGVDLLKKAGAKQ
jgi:transposase-like protein